VAREQTRSARSFPRLHPAFPANPRSRHLRVRPWAPVGRAETAGAADRRVKVISFRKGQG
jgi:hypothetical protein